MAQKRTLTQVEAAQRKRRIVASLIIFILIPATIIIGMRFGQSRYSIISVLILIYTMAPFFMVFENRKPKAREIVLCQIPSASQGATICVGIRRR